jgi:hypothetical protein
MCLIENLFLASPLGSRVSDSLDSAGLSAEGMAAGDDSPLEVRL